MTMLSDEELAEALRAVTHSVNTDRGMFCLDLIEAHIDALTAQRDNARSIAVSLEQELAEVQAIPQRWVIGSGGPQPWSEMDPESDADQIAEFDADQIAEFDAVAKVALDTRTDAQKLHDWYQGIDAEWPENRS